MLWTNPSCSSITVDVHSHTPPLWPLPESFGPPVVALRVLASDQRSLIGTKLDARHVRDRVPVSESDILSALVAAFELVQE